MKTQEFLIEAKARIEHPEDRILDDGSAGAKEAVASLLHAANTSENISIKFDGSPALIAGYVNGKFTLTDKAGLSKMHFPTNSRDVFGMLYMRKQDQEGRSEYAKDVASLFGPVQKMMPDNFQGLVQFDVMWFRTPDIVSGNFQIKPNKVLYQIPVNSELGKEIANSTQGIVVHSYFEKYDDDEPRAITDFKTLGLKPVSGLVVLNPKVTFQVKPDKAIVGSLGKVNSKIEKSSQLIDSFIDKSALMALKITDLPALMKRFLAERSRTGKEAAGGMQTDFVEWLKTFNISDKKKVNALQYIKINFKGYNAIWSIITDIVTIKTKILNNLQANAGDIQASIDGVSSHEGYVVDAPTGKIKIVNRPLFMRKP